jgi:hypothetical protein
MTSNPFRKHWTTLMSQIRQKWPETNAKALTSIDGDLSQLAAHLSDAHDLTLQEAAEVIDAWTWTALNDTAVLPTSQAQAA